MLYFNNIYLYFILYKDIFFIKKKINIYIFIIYIILYLFIEFLLIDDEPIWEPMEWTLIQTWLIYIYLFSWIVENLKTSKFGLFTSRDKKVYIGLFKSWWIVEFWICFNIFVASIFVITPFFFEINYYISNLNTFWNWINRYYFFKLSNYFFYLIYILNLLIKLNKWYFWKLKFLLSIIILIMVFFTLFFLIFNFLFCFYSDYFRYRKINWIKYFSLSKGPQRWGYGVDSKYDRDRFNYHKTPWKFWFKNDPLYSSFFIITNLFLILSYFFVVIKLIIFIKYIFVNKHLYFTFVNFIFNNFKYFFFIFFLFFLYTLFSVIFQFLRFPLGLYGYNKYIYIFLIFKKNIFFYFYVF